MMRFAMIAAGLTLATAPLVAQANVEGERPGSWRVRFDRANADASSLVFVTMTPGWHITTGPAGIFYDSGNTAVGEFRLESEIFLFPTNGRDREAFGIIFGGRDLEGTDQAYSYFLIRNTGAYLVKRRAGSGTSEVVSWTDSDVIVKQSGEETAKNVLAIEAGADAVDFLINGEKVATVPRSELDVDGVVGLRANHSINMHVTSLKLTQRTGT